EAAPGDLRGCDTTDEVFALARRLVALEREQPGSHVEAIFAGHTHAPVTAGEGGVPIAQPRPYGLRLAHIALAILPDRAPSGGVVVAPPVEICSVKPSDGTCSARKVEGRLDPPDFYGPVAADPAIDQAVAADLERAAAARAE